LAVLASPRNVKQVEHQKKIVADRQAKLVGKLQKEKTSLDGISVSVTVQAGEEGKLFGSVTTADIASALAKEGLTVDRRRILLDEPIRVVGEREVDIKLHAQVIAKIKVIVVAAEE
jgi:large subunit ribosomal protein L9